MYRGGILLTALASALLIVGASSAGTVLSRLLERSPLRWIGSRSYSIYLWHWPVFMLTRPGFDVNLPALPLRIVQVAVTFALAEWSYRWVETPVRRNGFRASVAAWRAKLGGWSVPQRVGLGAGILSAGLLLLRRGSIQPVTAGAQLETMPVAQSTPSATRVSGMPTRAAAVILQRTAAPATRAVGSPTASLAARLPGVTLIGDTIMQGAAPMMDDVLGEDIYIDAARKRKMEDVPALVETLAAEGQLGRVVVIHLGSNRPFDDHVLDEVMKALLAEGVERVIFIDVHRPIGWEDYVNQKFADGQKRWPEAELIDWDAIAHSEQSWFIEDQTHLSYAGSAAYVNAIQQQLNDSP